MLGTDILQPTHLLLILLVALLVLGPKRLPEVGRALGRGLRDFRHGISGVQDEARGMFGDVMDDPTQPTQPTELPDAAAMSVAHEPVAPAFAEEPVAAPARVPPVLPVATATKVAPVEADPADYAD
jgi:TatA/E family protein of Tat protein translocase